MSEPYSNRIFPNQPLLRKFYQGEQDLMTAMYALLQEHSDGIAQHFKLNKHPTVDFADMSTPPVQLSLLKFLIDITQTKTFLEIGTFIGSTAMHVAEFIGPEAEVVTIEKFDEFAKLATQNFRDNNLADRITLHVGDAYEVMQSLPNGHFDFIYVDGDKGRYPELTRLAEDKLSKKGIIFIDDIFFQGDALNENPTTEKGLGCKKLLEQYKDVAAYSKYLLPINNGVLLLKRLA